MPGRVRCVLMSLFHGPSLIPLTILNRLLTLSKVSLTLHPTLIDTSENVIELRHGRTRNQ
jgi:hypothetical protein